MGSQSACIKGCIVTLVAFVWFLPTVCFQMCPEIACMRGSIITLVAFVCLLSTVFFTMCPQITCPRRCIVTLCAFVWLLFKISVFPWWNCSIVFTQKIHKLHTLVVLWVRVVFNCLKVKNAKKLVGQKLKVIKNTVMNTLYGVSILFLQIHPIPPGTIQSNSFKEMFEKYNEKGREKYSEKYTVFTNSTHPSWNNPIKLCQGEIWEIQWERQREIQ